MERASLILPILRKYEQDVGFIYCTSSSNSDDIREPKLNVDCEIWVLGGVSATITVLLVQLLL